MPRLTVLMPVHNGRATIARAISSTLNAMPRDAELVVIDDGSVDDTPSALSGVTDRRLRVLQNAEKSGVAASLQRALEASSSELVARMDADDICLPWRFVSSVKALSRYDAVFTGVIHFGGARLRPTSPNTISTVLFNLTLLLENPFPHPTFLSRRTHVEEVGGYRNVKAEDYDLWLRMAAAGSAMARLPVPTVLYRHHDSQVTKINRWREEALTERGFVESYEAFAQKVYGVAPDWLNDLVAQHASERTDALRALLITESSGQAQRARQNLMNRFERIIIGKAV